MSDCAPGSSKNCDEILHDLETYLDGELDGVTSEEIQAHIGDCPPCKDRADLEECVRELLRSRCAEQAPPSLIARLESKLSEWST